jgi:hypothetical protein
MNRNRGSAIKPRLAHCTYNINRHPGTCSLLFSHYNNNNNNNNVNLTGTSYNPPTDVTSLLRFSNGVRDVWMVDEPFWLDVEGPQGMTCGTCSLYPMMNTSNPRKRGDAARHWRSAVGE